MAMNHDFLATEEGDKTTIRAGIDQKEAIGSPFNPCVLPGSFAVYHKQFTFEIPSNG